MPLHSYTCPFPRIHTPKCVYILYIYDTRICTRDSRVHRRVYGRHWIETVGGDCKPRGSASRSDTIVIGKPISSTRNILARYPVPRSRGSLIPISARLRPFYELETSVDRFNDVFRRSSKICLPFFPVSLFPSFLSRLLLSTPARLSLAHAILHVVKTS